MADHLLIYYLNWVQFYLNIKLNILKHPKTYIKHEKKKKKKKFLLLKKKKKKKNKKSIVIVNIK